MTTLQEQTVRKALQGLFPTVLIDLTVEYLPRVILHSFWLLPFLSKGPVTLQQHGQLVECTPTNFDYAADLYEGHSIRERGWWNILYDYKNREVNKITLPTLTSYLVEDHREYTIEIDPDRQSILSIDSVLINHNVC